MARKLKTQVTKKLKTEQKKTSTSTTTTNEKRKGLTPQKNLTHKPFLKQKSSIHIHTITYTTEIPFAITLNMLSQYHLNKT